MVYIRIETEIRPTEDVHKVMKAVANLVYIDKPKIEELGRGYKILIVESTDLSVLQPLHDILRRQRILDTARSYMYRHKRGEVVTIMVNKQVAYQGRISLVENPSESPLGAITITISSPQIDKVIDWLAPKTAHGRPLWEIEMPRDV
ncbi:MAG: RNA-binding domain-containing protein [Ignisphaera sp.]